MDILGPKPKPIENDTSTGPHYDSDKQRPSQKNKSLTIVTPKLYCNSEIIEKEKIKQIINIVKKDIYQVYPELNKKLAGKSDLEKEAYLETEDGKNYVTDLKERRSDIINSSFLFKLESSLPDYDPSINAFEISIKDYLSIDDSYTSIQSSKSNKIFYTNTINAIWCNGLPIKIKSFRGVYYSVLRINPGSKATALMLERNKHNIHIYFGFRLSGKLKKLPYTSLHNDDIVWESYAMAKDMVILLVDSKTDKVVFSRMYHTK